MSTAYLFLGGGFLQPGLESLQGSDAQKRPWVRGREPSHAEPRAAQRRHLRPRASKPGARGKPLLAGTQRALRTRPHCSPAGKCRVLLQTHGTCHRTPEQTSFRPCVLQRPAGGDRCPLGSVPRKAAPQPCSEPGAAPAQRTALRGRKNQPRRGRGTKVLDAPAACRPAPHSTSRHACPHPHAESPPPWTTGDGCAHGP